MSKYKQVIVVIILSTMCFGCSSWLIRPTKVVLLPEERIFTVVAGQKITVQLDKKNIEMTFPDDMKLVSPTVLVRQEEKLNNELLKNVKAKADANKKLGIIGSVFAALATGLGIFFKMKSWFPKVKGNIEIK